MEGIEQTATPTGGEAPAVTTPAVEAPTPGENTTPQTETPTGETPVASDTQSVGIVGLDPEKSYRVGEADVPGSELAALVAFRGVPAEQADDARAFLTFAQTPEGLQEIENWARERRQELAPQSAASQDAVPVDLPTLPEGFDEEFPELAQVFTAQNTIIQQLLQRVTAQETSTRDLATALQPVVGDINTNAQIEATTKWLNGKSIQVDKGYVQEVLSNPAYKGMDPVQAVLLDRERKATAAKAVVSPVPTPQANPLANDGIPPIFETDPVKIQKHWENLQKERGVTAPVIN